MAIYIDSSFVSQVKAYLWAEESYTDFIGNNEFNCCQNTGFRRDADVEHVVGKWVTAKQVNKFSNNLKF